MPFSRGNTFDPTDGAPAQKPQMTETPQPQPAAEAQRPSMSLPESPTGVEPKPADPRGPAVGVIADAIRNIQKSQARGQYVNLEGDSGQNFLEDVPVRHQRRRFRVRGFGGSRQQSSATG